MQCEFSSDYYQIHVGFLPTPHNCSVILFTPWLVHAHLLTQPPCRELRNDNVEENTDFEKN